MKHLVKKAMAGLLALTLALTLALGLCACGGPRTPAEVMAQAGENLAKARSMTFDMTMEMSMSAGDETVDMTMRMTGETTTEPAVVHAGMDIDLGALGSMAMEMYAEQSETTVTTYISALGQWMKEETALDEASAVLDAKGDMGSSLALAANLEEAGTETVGGVEATRYDGVITGENLRKVLESNGMLGEFGDILGLGDSMEDGLGDTAELGDIPISIWIDREAMLPVRYEMDMTEMMQKLLAQVWEAVSMEYPAVSRMKISMTIGGIDTVEAIVIPDEARNAQPVG